MTTTPPTMQERIEATFKMLDAFAAAPGERGEEMRKGIADSISTGWEKMVSEVGMGNVELMLSSFRGGSWRKIGEHLPVSFKMEHHIPLTEKDLAAGPESGWWYIRSTIAPFSMLPGIPYIYIPATAWLVTGIPPVAPICRIVDSPFGI